MARPREYDRESLLLELEQYYEATPIPIIARFASDHDVPRELLYDWDEFSTLLKRCIAKKEAALEEKALSGDINVTMAIFSLKQLGWTDRTEQTVQGKGGGPIVISSTDAEL